MSEQRWEEDVTNYLAGRIDADELKRRAVTSGKEIQYAFLIWADVWRITAETRRMLKEMEG